MSFDKVAETIKNVAVGLEKSGISKMVLGTYSDGTTRSIPDAISGELYSPKTKAKAIKKGKKKHKSNRVLNRKEIYIKLD